jgi:hypothetical protein
MKNLSLRLIQHYLSGMNQATKWLVDGYETIAKMHQFPNARAMIARHLRLDEPTDNTDAKQKLATLALFDELTLGMDTFNHGNLFEPLVFMLELIQFTFELEAVIRD